jgi:class 3 adenylate cyclase
MRCPSCGAEQPDTELVCMECNNYLNLSEEELDRVERYRLSTHTELLCVMFCDISGFTTIANQSLGQSQRILALHGAIVQTEVERDRGGEIVNTAGDGVLAVFANPATATECALRIHEATFRYYERTLDDPALLAALQVRGIKRTPAEHDVAHHVHVGMHLGIVTRGGRTSRDVFGHNVNIACRVCDLGGPGQTYMSPPVYDNARLIIGDRLDLRWLAWEELPIRGIATPMTAVGVAQHPYYQILPPRGIKPAKAASRVKVPLALAAVGLVAALLAGGVVATVMARRNGQTALRLPLPRPIAARLGEEALPPIVASVAEPVAEEAPAPESENPPTATDPATTAPVLTGDANAASSGTVTTPVLTPPDKATPPATEEPVKAPAMDPDIRAYFPHLLKAGTSIELGDGKGKIPGTLMVIRAKRALLVAVGVEEQTTAESQLALVFDGNRDGKLQSEAVSPYLDLLVSAAGPGAETPLVLLALLDGAPGDPLEISGVAGKVVPHSTRTVWMFRIPYDELGVTSGMRVNFRIDYTADKDTPTVHHPPSAEGKALREIMIP